jgi:predicted membrane chloride channel (bestrophin family)
MDNKFKLWLNVKITERALAKQLEVMCKADKRTRSDFVRLLIAKEFNERVADQSQGIDTEKIKAQKQQKKSAALK